MEIVEMADVIMQFPGGKSGEFKRIRSIMPDHKCWVEGFGGSGAMTLNKEPATVDVYNDLDSEIVNFFIVYREAPERLVSYLDKIPYSYSAYEDFVDAFYGEANEDRKDDALPGDTLTNNLLTSEDIAPKHIKRAAIFFTLRYTQFGAKYQGRSGFGRSKVQNGAETFANAKERLDEFVGCWDHVTIENVSYEKLIDSYDGEETLFYFDPPYVGTEGYYRKSKFNHKKFCKRVKDIEGHFIISYDAVPKLLEEFTIEREESTNFIDSGVKGEGKDTHESLIMNFHPSEVQTFRVSGQQSVTELVTNDDTEESSAFEDSEHTQNDEQEDTEESDGIRVFDT